MSLGLGFFNPFVISANGTTNLGGQGSRLFCITINSPGSAWVLTVTDGPGGAPIATITVTAAVTLFYKAVITNSINIVASGTTSGNATIMYS